MYTVYIPSKGRASNCFTARHLEKDGVRFKVVVEPQDEQPYGVHYSKENMVVMDKNDQGIAYARRFIKQYSHSEGEGHHWQMDDDIKAFLERNVEEGKSIKCAPNKLIEKVENHVKQYTNVGIAAFKPDLMFAWAAKNDIDINKMCCCAYLIDNKSAANWRDDTIEDVDYTMQVLTEGLVTMVFNRCIISLMPTGKNKGGNCSEAHYGRYGTLIENLGRQWDGVFKMKTKNGEPRLARSRVWSTFKHRPIKKHTEHMMARMHKAPTVKSGYKRVNIKALTEDPKNARRHGRENLAAIEASLVRFGQVEPLVVRKGTGVVVGGNGRLEVMRGLGWTEAEVREVDLTDAEAQALSLALNRSGELASWDEGVLMANIKELVEADDFNLDDIAAMDFDGITFDKAEADILDTMYSRKIETPVYQIRGERPEVSDLVDDDKTKTLVDEIDRAEVPDDIKVFLKQAADRHTVFHFRNIAEYYAHADEDVQSLMERSALVIIDVDKAIENGFVHMTKQMSALVTEERDHAG